MLKRIRRLWKLTQKEPTEIDKFMKLSDKEIMAMPDEGDGNAVFISQGTQKDYDDFLKEEDGTKPWYDRLKNL